MPRIRTIKPEFFRHDGIADLPPLARIAYVGLWCCADREGRLADNPRRLKAEILPYDDVDFDSILEALARAGFVERYTVDGRCLIDIPGFRRHQWPSNKEQDSILPAPPSTALRETRTGSESGPALIQIPPSPDPDLARTESEPTPAPVRDGSSPLGREGKGTEGKEGGPEGGKPSACADGVVPAPPRGKRGRPPVTRHPEAADLCTYLADRARDWKPDVHIETGKRSLDGMDALLRIDKRDPARVRAVLSWLFTGGYSPSSSGFDWRPNVLSGASLRKQWDKLEVAYNAAGGQPAGEEDEWTGR